MERERRPQPVTRGGGDSTEYTGVVMGGAEQSRGCEEGPGAGDEEHPRHDRRVPRPVEHQVRRGYPEPDEYAAVQVCPERQERDGEPDPARRPLRLAPQQEDEHREEREREQLSSHDQERGGGSDDYGDEHRGAQSVAGVCTPQIESESDERDCDRDGLGESETLVAEQRLEPVEDELAEGGRVPPLRRRGGIRNRVRQRSRANDQGADGGEPARIGADAGRKSRRGAAEGCGDPRQTDGRPGGVGVHASLIGRSARKLHSARGDALRRSKAFAKMKSVMASSGTMRKGFP